MKIYDCARATNPRRLRMFLLEKEVFDEIPRVEVDIFAGENLEEAYRKINPRGVLPTLELDDGTCLDETPAICRYFEEIYPQNNLMGDNAWSKALIESRARQIEFDGLMAMSEIFRNTSPVFSNRVIPGIQGLHAIPELASRGQKRLQIFFKQFNNVLANSEYAAGDKFSFADITGYCGLDNFIQRGIPLPEGHHHLHRWFKLCADRPSAAASGVTY